MRAGRLSFVLLSRYLGPSFVSSSSRSRSRSRIAPTVYLAQHRYRHRIVREMATSQPKPPASIPETSPSSSTTTPSSLPPNSQPQTSPQTKSPPPPIILCGPSGTGKSTLLTSLRRTYPTLGFSISHTTRPPRPHELNGVDYHFVTREEFTELVARGAFVEHAVFSGQCYGTSFKAVRDVVGAGRTCILDIDVEGVKQLREVERLEREGEGGEGEEKKGLGARARVLFIAPPSLSELAVRLRGRGTDGAEEVALRLEQAAREMAFAEEDVAGGRGVFDRVIVNDDLEVCWAEVRGWVGESMGVGVD